LPRESIDLSGLAAAGSSTVPARKREGRGQVPGGDYEWSGSPASATENPDAASDAQLHYWLFAIVALAIALVLSMLYVTR